MRVGGFIRSGSMAEATDNVNLGETPIAADAAEASGGQMSLLAVVALVVGVLSVFSCPVPVLGLSLGLFAGVMGLIALVRVSRSKQKMRGKTAAMAGTILGTMAFLFGVVMIVGITMFVKAAYRYSEPMLALQSGKVDEARVVFAQGVAEKLTDEVGKDFLSRVEAQLGKYKGGPTDLIDFAKQAYDRVSVQGAALGNVPSTRDVVPYPLPVDFEKGEALLIVLVDQREATAQFQYGKITNIGVTRVGVADIVWLFPIDGGKKNGGTLNPEGAGKF